MSSDPSDFSKFVRSRTKVFWLRFLAMDPKEQKLILSQLGMTEDEAQEFRRFLELRTKYVTPTEAALLAEPPKDFVDELTEKTKEEFSGLFGSRADKDGA